MKGIIFVMVCAMSALMVRADGFHLKDSCNNTLVDWTSSDSYVEEAAPSNSAVDIVYMPQDFTANVDDTTIAGLSTFARLVPTTNSVLAVNISNDAAVSCAITSFGAVKGDPGKIEKSGSGMLLLTSCDTVKTSKYDVYDYYVDQVISGGSVRLPADDSTVNSLMLRDLNVGDNAVLYISTNFTHDIQYLSGSGLVINDGEKMRSVRLTGYKERKTFSGRLDGKIKVLVMGSANLTGTQNTSGGQGFYINPSTLNDVNGGAGMAGLAYIGDTSEASSAGSGSYVYFSSSGAELLYLGNGETAKKNMRFIRTNVAYPPTINAGAYGGLEIASTLSPGMTDAEAVPLVHRLVLTGSNTAESVISAKMPLITVGETNVMFHITKRGTGTWRFSSTNEGSRKSIGGLAVEEGTLAFDTIAEAGVACSLGDATNFVETNAVPAMEGNFVPYAVRLGNRNYMAKADPVFQYVGDSTVKCSTRPIVVDGRGHLRYSGNGRMSFAGISAAAGSTNAMLVLDGASTAANEVRNLTDGTGGEALGIEKDGEGTWTIQDDVAFSGPVNVKAGTLVLRSPDKYTYFKFTIRETWGTQLETEISDPSCIQLNELALYSIDGDRINTGMTFVSGLDIGNLVPGTAMYDKASSAYSSARSLNGAFEDTLSEYWWAKFPQMTLGSDETTWVSILMRLPDDSAEVGSYDFVPTQTVHAGTTKTHKGAYIPRVFSLSGSTDGVNWHELSVTNILRGTAGRWAKDTALGDVKKDFAPDQVRTGFPVNVSCEINTTAFANISTVSVAPGATLKVIGTVTLKGLTLSAAGNGTIQGATFAASGSIDMTDVGDPLTAVAGITFTDVKGLENLSKWALHLNGKPTFGYRIFYENGQFLLKPQGLTISIK